jgi:ATP-binding cassette subfamily B protein
VHWSIAPAYLLTVPLLGGLSSLLSRRIKTVQKRIVNETTALAGATTESLRNIELVKSLDLAQQEIDRLNSTTNKILKLELEKVRYLRSLSFVQGSIVNLLRTSILFLMLYLIYTQRITFGQFFSLFIYSFFIFGPLRNWETWSTPIARPKHRSTTSNRFSECRYNRNRSIRWH